MRAVLEHAQVGEELMTVAAGIRRCVRRQLRGAIDPPLRDTQVELLRTVEESPGIGVAAAARAMHLADNSVSTLVNQLVELGMLRREVSPADRRAARLSLTGAAVRRLAAWRQARGELVGAHLARLPAPDRETLARALPALRRLLDELAGGAP